MRPGRGAAATSIRDGEKVHPGGGERREMVVETKEEAAVGAGGGGGGGGGRASRQTHRRAGTRRARVTQPGRTQGRAAQAAQDRSCMDAAAGGQCPAGRRFRARC